jgi:peptidyl-prolyl cis-trans isomerase SurA
MMQDRRPTRAKRLPILCAAVIVFAALMLSPTQAQIVLYVTGQPITAYDIEQRSKLIALSTGKAKSRQEVIDDLIDDRLKISAAKRFNFELSQADVDSTFATMARSSGMTADQFGKMLEGRGVNPATLKARLKADMTWNQLVRGKFGQSLNPSEKDIFEAEAKSSDQKEAGVEYALTPITFVVPRGSPANLIEARKREADALRQRFQSCSTGLPFARALREVVVRAPIRRNSADLSPALREVLGKIEVGKVTPPEVTEGGVEVFAVCERKETNADSPTKRKVRDEIFQRRFQNQADRYLKELRAQAMIEYKQQQ